MNLTWLGQPEHQERSAGEAPCPALTPIRDRSTIPTGFCIPLTILEERREDNKVMWQAEWIHAITDAYHTLIVAGGNYQPQVTVCPWIIDHEQVMIRPYLSPPLQFSESSQKIIGINNLLPAIERCVCSVPHDEEMQRELVRAGIVVQRVVDSAQDASQVDA